MIFAAIMATTVSLQTYYETVIFGIILVSSVLSTSLILQNKKSSFNVQLGLSSFLIVFIYSGGPVDPGLLASQFVVVHGAINVLFILFYHLLKSQFKVRAL